MGVLDDPRKAGQRQYCSKVVETPGDFVHREDMHRCYDLDGKSEKMSIYKEYDTDSA